MTEDRFTNTPEDAATYERHIVPDYGDESPTLAELQRDEYDDEEPRACPDCEQGKHRNCTDTAWDNEMDMLVPCPCAEAGHKP